MPSWSLLAAACDLKRPFVHIFEELMTKTPSYLLIVKLVS